jgi:hypothetical protein
MAVSDMSDIAISPSGTMITGSEIANSLQPSRVIHFKWDFEAVVRGGVVQIKHHLVAGRIYSERIAFCLTD